MNLHKVVLATLFAACAPSLNAGIFCYDDAEIEEKNPDSYMVDKEAGTITAEFKQSYEKRKNMLLNNKFSYLIPAIVSKIAMSAATLSIVTNLASLSNSLTKALNETTLSKFYIQCGKQELSDLNKSIIAWPIAALASCYFYIKVGQAKRKIADLPKEERVPVANLTTN